MVSGGGVCEGDEEVGREDQGHTREEHGRGLDCYESGCGQPGEGEYGEEVLGDVDGQVSDQQVAQAPAQAGGAGQEHSEEGEQR